MPTLPTDVLVAPRFLLPGTLPNYFTSHEVAARYAKVRPLYHDGVAARIRKCTGVARFRRVLDAGCGSGHSSVALAGIGEHVVAMDASQEMLDHATVRPNITYQRGFAEQLDFKAGEFDLVAVGSALHWFDQDRFFEQCQKVLATDGVLAVYNDHFTTHMQDEVECKRWMRTRFAKRFPPPVRGMRDFDESKAAGCGFTVEHSCSFSHVVPFLRADLIDYLLTRSNTLAAIASGKETEQSIIDWLTAELAAIVPDGATGMFIFKCNLWLLRKSAACAGKLL